MTMVNHNVTAINGKQVIVLIVLFLNTYYCKCQIIHNLDPVESINIPKSNDGKINTFIFFKKDNVSPKVTKLKERLENINIDFSNFSIHEIVMDMSQVCVPGKYIILDGISLGDAYPAFDGYLILVNTDNPKYEKLLAKRVDMVKSKNSIVNIRGKTSLKSFEDLEVFIKFITQDVDTNQYVKVSEFENFIKYDSLKRINERNRDSIAISSLKKIPETRKKFFLTLNYLPSILNQVSESGLKPNNIEMANINLSATQLHLSYFLKSNFIGGFEFGLGLGISYSTYSAQLRSKNSEGIIDTLDIHAIDKDGDEYKKIAIGKDLNENIYIDYLSSSINLCLKKSFYLRNGDKKLNGYLSINPGIKISQIINSTYNATQGTISWLGYYKKYNMYNTMFGNDYGFYNDVPVNQEKQVLELKKTFISPFVSLDFGIKGEKSENLYFYLSLFGEKSSNFLNDNRKKGFPSNNVSDYNSLLYRSDKLNINSFGLKCGLTFFF